NAAAQKRASRSGSAQSITNWNRTATGLSHRSRGCSCELACFIKLRGRADVIRVRRRARVSRRAVVMIVKTFPRMQRKSLHDHGESAGTSVDGMVCAHRPGGPPGSLAGDRINPLLALVHDGVVHLDAHDATDAHVRSRRAERSGIGPLAARQVEPNTAAGPER